MAAGLATVNATFGAALRRQVIGAGRGLATAAEQVEANVAVQGEERRNPLKLLVTCEHAGNELPARAGWAAKDLERGLPGQHWAFDPGAREFAVELAARVEAPAVLSRFSRLFVDVNRPVASATLARKACDGEAVGLNADLDQAQLLDRVQRYYVPYHWELERVAQASAATTAVSIHTYTANYEGSIRPFEVGILYSAKNEGLAKAMLDGLERAGVSARLNEPWSAKDGFMFAADCFVYNSSPAPGLRDALMLEFRNDVCLKPEWRAAVLDVIVPHLEMRQIC